MTSAKVVLVKVESDGRMTFQAHHGDKQAFFAHDELSADFFSIS